MAPLQWTSEDCRHRWRRGVPLLAEADATILPAALEELVAATLEFLAAIGEEEGTLQRVGEAWDAGDLVPTALFPQKGRIGAPSVAADLGVRPEVLAFLACGALRPALDRYFAACRAHLGDDWDLGVCPFCGAPPGFADLIETGQRRLACHVCASGWTFQRLRCPFCGTQSSKDLVRLDLEEREEGYFISACARCKGYMKEVDRRVRWNAGPALVEDWGSPHFDLVAARAGYWRPLPSLIQLAHGV